MQGGFGSTAVHAGHQLGEPSAAAGPPFSKATSLTATSSGDLEVTVDFLTEVDKLVQLIECPIFTCKEEILCGEGAVCSAPPPRSAVVSSSCRTNK